MSHFHLDSHSFLSLNSFLTSSTKSFKYGKSCNVKHHKLGLADCCLMPTQQFFSYTMARWNDDEVRFVLDQHAKLDFYRLANWNNNPQIDMSPHSDTLSWFQPNPSLGFLLTAVCFKQLSGEATKVIIFSSPDLLSPLSVRRPSVNFSHFNQLLWSHWANFNQTLVEWSLDGPLPKLCSMIPTSNQDGRQAKNRKKGGMKF